MNIVGDTGADEVMDRVVQEAIYGPPAAPWAPDPNFAYNRGDPYREANELVLGIFAIGAAILAAPLIPAAGAAAGGALVTAVPAATPIVSAVGAAAPAVGVIATGAFTINAFVHNYDERERQALESARQDNWAAGSDCLARPFLAALGDTAFHVSNLYEGTTGENLATGQILAPGMSSQHIITGFLGALWAVPLVVGTINRGRPESTAGASTSRPPTIREEDVTTGPHGPDRAMATVISRALQPRRLGGGVQGRWLSRPLAEESVVGLDFEQMQPNRAYSVPIPEGAGELVRPYNEYPPSDLLASERIMSEAADRAVVVLMDGEIHTYPIGPENPAYHIPAPRR